MIVFCCMYQCTIICNCLICFMNHEIHSEKFQKVALPNSWHPKIGWASKGKNRIPTIHFQVLLLMVQKSRNHQLIWEISPLFTGFYTFQVVGLGISEPSFLDNLTYWNLPSGGQDLTHFGSNTSGQIFSSSSLIPSAPSIFLWGFKCNSLKCQNL